MGTWEDFTDKFGFGDGDAAESLDYKAREVLCAKLSSRPELCDAHLVAREVTGGLHNQCLIEIHTHDGRTVELPSSLQDQIEQIVADSYVAARTLLPAYLW